MSEAPFDPVGKKDRVTISFDDADPGGSPPPLTPPPAPPPAPAPSPNPYPVAVAPQHQAAPVFHTQAMSPVADIPPGKDVAVATVLACVFTGAGHMYLGRWGRGFAFLGGAILAAILTFLLLGIGGIAIVIWSVIDAHNLAKQAHAYHEWARWQRGQQQGWPGY